MGFIMRAEKDYVVTRSEVLIFFFKQETAYEMRISDWSSDVCSSDLFQLKQHLWRIPPGVNLLQPQGRCRIWKAPGVDMEHGGNRHVHIGLVQTPLHCGGAVSGQGRQCVEDQLSVREIDGFGQTSCTRRVERGCGRVFIEVDRKSTRLNSSH